MKKKNVILKQFSLQLLSFIRCVHSVCLSQKLIDNHAIRLWTFLQLSSLDDAYFTQA